LRANWAVHVCRIAEQEAAAIAEASGRPMMNAIRREPGARLDRQTCASLAAQRGHHSREVQVLPLA